MIYRYYLLTKPGIIRGNLIVVAGGFFLASKGVVDIRLLIATLVGSALVIASGCVFNNYIDRDIDGMMTRTKKRALVRGEISGSSAIIFAVILGISGLLALGIFANALTVLVGIVGLFSYVVLYSIAKRRTVHGTLVGSISGAIPPVAGYVAVTDDLDLGALLLFLVLVCWQMPHFYAIAIYRSKEYARAKLPVLPLVKGIQATKIYMLCYIVAFIDATILLTIFGFTGYTYLVVVGLLGLVWFGLGVHGFKTNNNDRWARRMFGHSLFVLIGFCIMISLASALP